MGIVAAQRIRPKASTGAATRLLALEARVFFIEAGPIRECGAGLAHAPVPVDATRPALNDPPLLPRDGHPGWQFSHVGAAQLRVEKQKPQAA